MVAMIHMGFHGTLADHDQVKVGWIVRRMVADDYLVLIFGWLGCQAANTMLLVFVTGGGSGSLGSD